MSEGTNHGKITRRTFLNASLAVAGGILALRPCRTVGAAEPKHARWAFLSDTHIAIDQENNYRGFYPYRNLHKAIEQIAGDVPEGAVVTGDLARLTGQMGDYENLRGLLTPLVGKRPIHLALGNHDHRANFLDAFETLAGPREAIKDKYVVTVDAGPARFILLDSLFSTDQTSGLLGKAQRTWLAQYLQRSDDKPIILFFHHSLRDTDGDLLDPPRLFDIIKPVTKVKALVYGHSHEYGFSQFEDIHLINLPATGYNFNDDQPVGWVEARLTTEGGEFILHALGGNTQIDGRVDGLRWRS